MVGKNIVKLPFSGLIGKTIMELSACFVLGLIILVPLTRAVEHSVINKTLLTRILLGNSTTSMNETVSFKNAYKECDCGYGSNGCHLVNGKKVCVCDSWKAQNGDKCQYCDCGIFSKKCYFENGEEKCDCFTNAAQTSYKTCKLCECGSDVKCEFQGYNKVCMCPDGYVQSYGKCEACDCGFNSDFCSINYRGVRKCTCKPGYVAEPEKSYSDDEKCVIYTYTSGWRVATYIEGILFGVIVIGLVVFILGKKNSI